mgnify:CR=1 FL=1
MKHLKIKVDKLEFDWELVFKDINFTINYNDKIAIVWPNWAWKTSFLKILTWEIDFFWMKNRKYLKYEFMIFKTNIFR